MLEAKSARREARGDTPLDIDAELDALAAPVPVADAGLRDEVRQLVLARNARRVRRGEGAAGRGARGRAAVARARIDGRLAPLRPPARRSTYSGCDRFPPRWKAE